MESVRLSDAKQCADQAGKSAEECFFKTKLQLTPQTRTVVVESTQPVFPGGIPFTSAEPGYSSFSVSGEYLSLEAQDSAPDLLAVKLVFSCGKENAAAVMKAAGGVLTGAPYTAYFTKGCGQVKLNISYTARTGTIAQRTIADLRKEQGDGLYLEAPAQ